MDSLEGLLRRINKLEATIERLQKLETRRMVYVNQPVRLVSGVAVAANTHTKVLTEGTVGTTSTVTLPSNISGVYVVVTVVNTSGVNGVIQVCDGSQNTNGFTNIYNYPATLNSITSGGAIVKTGIIPSGVNAGKQGIDVFNNNSSVSLYVDLFAYFI